MTESVLFNDQDIVAVGSEQLQQLRSLAVTAPLKRARLCMHHRSNDPVQEMIIAFTGDSYVRPHRHRAKSESYHVIEGLLTVVLFDQDGLVKQRFPLGPPGSGRANVYRMSSDEWHTVLVETPSAIIHEATNGPYVPGETEFAPWSPALEESQAVADFLTRLQTHREPHRQPANPTGTPTLTAIICNYNHGKSVGRAIEAMLAQSRPADELIVVDDGSTDDSVSMIQAWVDRHPHIVFLRNEHNRGFHATLQRALAAATGDFIYSGAADDHVLPGFFEGAMQLAAKYPGTGIICGQVVSTDPWGRTLSTDGLAGFREPVFLDPPRYLREVLETEPPTHSLSSATIFHRQSLLDVGGMRADLDAWGDTFALRAIGLQRGICYWPHPAVAWTVLPGSMSQLWRANPRKAWQVVDRAARLMQSDQFRGVFPSDYVERWLQRSRDAIIRGQLQSAIDGYQAVQACCRDVASRSGLPTRIVLGVLRRMMTAFHLATFWVMRNATAIMLRSTSKAA